MTTKPDVIFTEETILATRQWYIDLAHDCINEATIGLFKVNDLAEYRQQQLQRIQEHKAGKWDNTLAFRQMAHYIQTGECVAILP